MLVSKHTVTVEITWLSTYSNRIVLQEKLIDLKVYILVKYVSYVKEIQEYFTKRKDIENAIS